MLVADIRSIERALGQRERRVDGRRMTPQEYRAWRERAIAALDHKLALYRSERQTLPRLVLSLLDDLERSGRCRFSAEERTLVARFREVVK